MRLLAVKYKVLGTNSRQSKPNYFVIFKIDFPVHFGSSREKSFRESPGLRGKRCERKTFTESEDRSQP